MMVEAHTDNTAISTSEKVHPKIYAWSTPDIPKYLNWLKIGYTEKQSVEKRVSQQASQLNIAQHVEWQYDARFQNGGIWFTDHEFHHFLTAHNVPREHGTEWFDFRPDHAKQKSEQLFKDFVFQDYSCVQQSEQQSTYQLRTEQMAAVEKTLEYARTHDNGEFLWNAKPRFGKTLTTYDFARKLDTRKVLIVTNRPAIANSWYDDFEKFISWQTDYRFVSTADTLNNRPVLNREQFRREQSNNPDLKMIAFLSLQDLKGSQYFGGYYDKLKWIRDLDWDLLVIDEAHEGVDTFRTASAFNQINRAFTLHLSGTPFKALAKGKFDDAQLFNWSYTDEQEAKSTWSDPERNNPYENLPKLNMFTYQMSQMITNRISEGADLDENHNVDYAFDLNEFFTTKVNGDFVHEKEVKQFLERLTTNKKYPFSTPELRNELKHTFWLVGNRVSSAKAMAKLIKQTPAFDGYSIIVAAGSGSGVDEEITNVDDNASSLNRVKDAIANNDRTITLSVGQLTTGVTVPEWTGILMLSNLASPSLYMQAAFRVQNPWSYTDQAGNLYQKKNAYVFDFAPERTLQTFDAFANDLNSSTTHCVPTSDDRKQNIKKLLNFFPVIGEDSEGTMVELDADQILSIPRYIRAKEVVKRGFMSNLLFSNIYGIFQAPQEVLDILDQIRQVSEGTRHSEDRSIQLPDIQVGKDGNVIVPNDIIIQKTHAIFGPKIYKTQEVPSLVESFETQESDIQSLASNFARHTVEETIRPKMSEIVNQSKGKITRAAQDKVIAKVGHKFASTIAAEAEKHRINVTSVTQDFDQKIQETDNQVEKEHIVSEKKTELTKFTQEFTEKISKIIETGLEEAQNQTIEEIEFQAQTDKKNEAESAVRDRLRGFARTIPSFIMAYGDEKLNLRNFDEYTPDDVFQEVTGITTDQFRKLRDGGQYQSESGDTKTYGGLFDEVTFNQSIKEFLDKKQQLANYFDESKDEDIFDYIPPQKTNQIFTPKSVVRMMVDQLEAENPGIFTDGAKTYIDLYMKSGLYSVEIVKRLFAGLKDVYPDKNERLHHILEHQVYGFAPSEIIYRIATNYIFGFDNNTISHKNFVMADTVPYAKQDNLQQLINEKLSK